METPLLYNQLENHLNVVRSLSFTFYLLQGLLIGYTEEWFSSWLYKGVITNLMPILFGKPYKNHPFKTYFPCFKYFNTNPTNPATIQQAK